MDVSPVAGPKKSMGSQAAPEGRKIAEQAFGLSMVLPMVDTESLLQRLSEPAKGTTSPSSYALEAQVVIRAAAAAKEG